jgi:hypothetical protein
MAIPGPRDALDMSGVGTDRDQPAWPDEFL